MNNLLRVPQELADLADKVRDFRLKHRQKLEGPDKQLLLAAEGRIRGLSTALGALLSMELLSGVQPQLKKLQKAIDKTDDLLGDITKLKGIIRGLAKVIRLATSIVDILTPQVSAS